MAAAWRAAAAIERDVIAALERDEPLEIVVQGPSGWYTSKRLADFAIHYGLVHGHAMAFQHNHASISRMQSKVIQTLETWSGRCASNRLISRNSAAVHPIRPTAGFGAMSWMDELMRFAVGGDRLLYGAPDLLTAMPYDEALKVCYVLESGEAPWTVETYRRAIRVNTPELHRMIRRHRWPREQMQAAPPPSSVADDVADEYSGAPRPQIRLVDDVAAPPGDRYVAKYRDREYAGMIRDQVEALTPEALYRLYYGKFSAEWNPVAADWYYADLKFKPRSLMAKRSAAMFEMHYHTLRAAVDKHRREQPAEAAELAEWLRPDIEREGAAALAERRTPKVPALLAAPAAATPG